MSDTWIPVIGVGAVFFVGYRAFSRSSRGMGIGLGAGGGSFSVGVDVLEFLFGSSQAGDLDGQGNAAEESGPSDKPGGTGGSASESGDGDEGREGSEGSEEQGSSGAANDGKGTSGSSGDDNGVGGGSGGGIGSGDDQGIDGGDLDEGGSKGEDEGGGEDEGDYEYDPYEGKRITVDLDPPDLSTAKLDAIRETVRTLVNGSILDPGRDEPEASKLPPELHVYDPEQGGLLRFWADVALHLHYDLPWGILDGDRPSHAPWIHLWNDILAYTAQYEWDTNGGVDDEPVPMSIVYPPAHQTKVRRRGLGDIHRRPLLVTRELRINPFTRRAL